MIYHRNHEYQHLERARSVECGFIALAYPDSYSACFAYGRAYTDIEPKPTVSQSAEAVDPFAGQRTTDNNPFAETQKDTAIADGFDAQPSSPRQDRRMSKEWGRPLHDLPLL